MKVFSAIISRVGALRLLSAMPFWTRGPQIIHAVQGTALLAELVVVVLVRLYVPGLGRVVTAIAAARWNSCSAAKAAAIQVPCMTVYHRTVLLA